MTSVLKRIYEKFSASTGERVHDERGHEIPDPTPMAPPVGYNPGPDLRSQIRAMIAQASLEAANAGLESLEEADDFDVGDDYEPASPYELDEGLPAIAELKRRKDEAEKVDPDPSLPTPKKRPSAPGQGASGTDSAKPNQSNDGTSSEGS